jgi:hypothetical protein
MPRTNEALGGLGPIGSRSLRFQHFEPQFGQRHPPIFAEIKTQTGIQIPAVITLRNKCSR